MPKSNARQTIADLYTLRTVRPHLGIWVAAVKIRINGQNFTVRTKDEADEILEAYADIL
jgi:cell division protein ZapA (FtsZ GTPase activity inhibitor)